MQKPADLKHTIYCDSDNYNCDEDNPCKDYCNCNELAFEDERYNLDKPLKGRVLAIASVGKWNGRKGGYKILGRNLNNALAIREDVNIIYSDGKNIRAVLHHHDSKHTVLYRMIRPNISDVTLERFLKDIYNSKEISDQRVGAITESLHDYVADIYGWRKQRKG